MEAGHLEPGDIEGAHPTPKLHHCQCPMPVVWPLPEYGTAREPNAAVGHLLTGEDR